MNCYTDFKGNKYYCLYPFKQYYYVFDSDGNVDYLHCRQDRAQNLIHREDGPAVEYKSGNKCWYFMGKLHREDSAAIIYYDNSQE